MSEQLPDFNTAPGWVDALGGVVTRGQIMGYRGPLDTADEWVRRIDREKLAGVIELAPDPSHAGMGTRHVGMDWAREMADAAIAALPELMGGGER